MIRVPWISDRESRQPKSITGFNWKSTAICERIFVVVVVCGLPAIQQTVWRLETTWCGAQNEACWSRGQKRSQNTPTLCNSLSDSPGPHEIHIAYYRKQVVRYNYPMHRIKSSTIKPDRLFGTIFLIKTLCQVGHCWSVSAHWSGRMFIMWFIRFFNLSDRRRGFVGKFYRANLLSAAR